MLAWAPHIKHAVQRRNGRESSSHILDPCSIVEGGRVRAGSTSTTTSLWLTTAESERGWFSQQAFRTGMFTLGTVAVDEAAERIT